MELHIFVEGELTYREYSRTIQSETGAVVVQWPVVEIVVGLIKVLDRKRKETNELGGSRLAALFLAILSASGREARLNEPLMRGALRVGVIRQFVVGRAQRPNLHRVDVEQSSYVSADIQ